MKKKISLILVTVMLVLLLMPISVFAYTGGFLQGVTGWTVLYSTNNGTGGTTNVTDGNTATSYTLQANGSTYDALWYTSFGTKSIGSYKLNASASGLEIIVKSNGVKYTISNPVIGTETPISYSGVTDVWLHNKSASSISVTDFDIFPDTIAPGNVTSLSQTHTETTANLTWTNPTDVDFNGVKIYKNGVYVTTLANTFSSYAISGLTSGTSYTYKVTSIDTAGNESTGSTITFTTNTDITPPANPTNVSVTSILQTSATLNFTTPADADFDKYKIYKNSTLIYTSPSGQAKSSAKTYSLTGLTDSTTYTMKVTSIDTIGNESTGSSVSFTTLSFDTIPPPVPTNLAATSVNSGSVQLNWDTNSQSAPDFAGWNVYKNGTKINGSLLTTNSYLATGLADNTQYTFVVKSVDTTGNESAASNSVSTLHDTISPLAPVGLAVNGSSSAVGSSPSATLTWDPNSEPDLAGYNVYADLVKQNTSLVTGTSYTTTNLTANVEYSFRITAVDTSNNESVMSSPVTYTFDTSPPPVPTSLTATPQDTEAHLNWDPVTASDLKGYNVYRNSVRVNASPITTTSFIDTGLTYGQTYTYTVASVDNVGNESAKSTAATATTVQPVTPIAPTGLKTSISNQKIVVSWDAVTASPAVTSYKVYRDGVLLSSVPTASYTDTTVTNGTKYKYEVAAVNSNGESPKSQVYAIPANGVDFSGNTLPFSVVDMFKTAVNYLGMFPSWILLALGVIFVPALIMLVIWLIDRKKQKENNKELTGLTDREKRSVEKVKVDQDKLKAKEIKNADEYFKNAREKRSDKPKDIRVIDEVKKRRKDGTLTARERKRIEDRTQRHILKMRKEGR